ncbi:MAG: helix-turn-helix domain-containing GNAT family N-acetyltransferase [Pseudomonadota bacterium]
MKPYSMLGQVKLGSQLRMFADAVTADAAQIYRHFDLNIDAKWFPVFYVLATERDSTVTSIAAAIGHSHVSVSKIVAELEAAKLSVSRKSRADSRRTLINLTAAGKKLVPKLMAQCEQVDRALTQLTEETGVDLWQALTVTRRSLKYFPLSERVKSIEHQTDLRVVDFAPKYAEAFKRLNVEWITQHWELEEADLKALDHPYEHILDRDGAILIALYQDEPVGTVALIPYDAETLELAKMAVSPTVQGKGIGRVLGDAALARAKRMGARRVYLESNSILAPALSLYEKLGFVHLENIEEASPYARCNVRMEKFFES